ncbi:ExbD/TolR family protein [Agarivorans gilvus]|uniref:Biopolymer transporter ExbD n=1 Tax=Agarivorans gilvus TaxID=680279 RepID=A0ABQ1I1Q3_9ALTE|nr:biopolymer transporter ExbD [Agarivorans gilvus]GGB08096.1 biopolymer transporter ExbD [Agarivorans gilvus]
MKSRRQLSLKQEENDINLTPMLDIVFIMLIFFIVSSSLVKPQGIEINPPTSSSASEQTRPVLILQLAADGSLFLDGQSTDLRLLKARLVQRKQQPAPLVLLQADQQATTGQLVKVLDQLRLAKVDYRLATETSPH